MLSKLVLEWSPLQDHPSNEAMLKACFKASGQQLKKFAFNKSWLARQVSARDVVKLPISFVNRSEVYPLCEDKRVRVIKESEHFVALHKPHGVHTHPLNYDETPNLVSWLASERASLLRVNGQGMDRGCLWRLDGETSGLVLYAKDDATYQRVRENFSTLFRKKYYLALVEGAASGARDVVHLLEASGPDGHKMRVGGTGQEARLHYRTLAQRAGKSLVLVELVTGVRHQIRAQMAALGFPLLGDELYGGSPAERMFLHCWRYELEGVSWVDNDAELFNDFFDLHGLLQVLTDELG